MAQKLHGMLNLSRIPKEFITTNKNGEHVVWIDVVPMKETDKYGNTHFAAVYDKENRKNIYVANLKPQDFSKSENSPHGNENSSTPKSDLPF